MKSLQKISIILTALCIKKTEPWISFGKPEIETTFVSSQTPNSEIKKITKYNNLISPFNYFAFASEKFLNFFQRYNLSNKNHTNNREDVCIYQWT